MSSFTMIDRFGPPTHDKAMKALKAATSAAGTTEPGAWAFYLGGPGHNGGNGSTYTNAFLDQLEASGVVLLPIFVGRQKELSHDRGVADAAAALVLHKQFHSRNTMIVTDIEQNTSAGKTASAPKRKAAVAYVEGWTKALNDKGFQAMVYGSFVLAADLAEFADPKPDAIWVARYRTHKADKSHLAHSIPGVPNNAFVGRRAWQYGGAFADHPNLNKEKTPAVAGGLVCDISVVHAAVFDGTGNKPTKTTKTTKKTPTKATKGGGTPPVAKPPKGIHVIASGETLFGLEDHFGLAHGRLFDANSTLLDTEARKHGHQDSGHGHFIFPGTRLVVPAG